MRLFGFIAISSMSIFLSACSIRGSNDHQKNYINNSREIASLVVPSDVPAIKKDSYYVIPPVVNNDGSRAVSLKPPTLQLTGEVPKRS